MTMHPSELLFRLRQLPQDAAATIGQLAVAVECLSAQSQQIQPSAPVAFTPDQLITEEELADWIRESLSTLRKWRGSGKGPKFVRKPRRVAYLVRDVQDWLDGQKVSSTAEADARRDQRTKK